MVGTLINVGTVVIGAAVGSVLGDRLPVRVRTTAMHGLSLMVVVIGIQKAVMTANPLIPLASILIGSVIGELVRIDDGLNWAGRQVQALVNRQESVPIPQPGADSALESRHRFARGFVTASLVFCVGPLAILGAMDDGLRGDYSTLTVKAMLDGFTALGFASTLGIGVGFAAIVVLVYQGALSLGAVWLRPLLTDPAIVELNATGGLLILGIGISLLEIKAIRVSNMLPALVIAPLLVAIAHAVFGRVAP